MLLNVGGMGYALDIGAKKPCEGQCTMLSLLASLEFADGSPAENEKGVSKIRKLSPFRCLTGLK